MNSLPEAMPSETPDLPRGNRNLAATAVRPNASKARARRPLLLLETHQSLLQATLRFLRFARANRHPSPWKRFGQSIGQRLASQLQRPGVAHTVHAGPEQPTSGPWNHDLTTLLPLCLSRLQHPAPFIGAEPAGKPATSEPLVV